MQTVLALLARFADCLADILTFCGFLLAFLYFGGFWFAQRVNFSGVPGPGLYRPYAKWPNVLGHRIYPIYLLLSWAVYRIGPFLWERANGLVRILVVAVGNPFSAALLLLAAVCVLTVVAAELLKSTDTSNLIRAWFRAKKEKLCPYVEIVQ